MKRLFLFLVMILGLVNIQAQTIRNSNIRINPYLCIIIN